MPNLLAHADWSTRALDGHGLPVATHTPSEVKAAVTGNGRADKAQVTLMITKILALAEAPR